MRANEFIVEYVEDLYSWVELAKNAILVRIKSGEIPDNPDSIKNAATALAMDMKDLENIGDVSAEMLADEVEKQIFHDRITAAGTLGGEVTSLTQ